MSAMTPRFAERFADQQAAFDALVVLTEAQAQDLRTRFGPDTPTLVIPPAVAPPDPHVGPSREPRSDDPRRRRILSFGPLETASRHHDVLRAAQPAMAADLGLTLDVVGEGDEADALLALAGDLGLAGRVSIVTPTADDFAPFDGRRPHRVGRSSRVLPPCHPALAGRRGPGRGLRRPLRARGAHHRARGRRARALRGRRWADIGDQPPGRRQRVAGPAGPERRGRRGCRHRSCAAPTPARSGRGGRPWPRNSPTARATTARPASSSSR